MELKVLTNKQVLQMALMEGCSDHLVDSLFDEFTDNLGHLLNNTSESELMKIKGVGLKKARQIKAINELARRLYLGDNKTLPQITTPKAVADLLVPEMKFLTQECMIALFLNVKRNIIGKQTISIGTHNATVIDIKAIFLSAIKSSAAFIILVHNHPSGDPAPSNVDIELTTRVAEAGRIMDIQLTDHIIIGGSLFVSMKSQGLF